MLEALKTSFQQADDAQIQKVQGDFTGQWRPDYHPLHVPQADFSDISNMRHTKTALVGVNGYTKINNVTALTSYPKGRAGFQLRTPHAQKSYIFTQQYNAALNTSKVYLNKGTPPNTSDFESTEFHTDASGASQGSFVEAPDNNVIYTNGVETLIYGGEESQISAFILATSITGLTLSNPVRYTDIMRNILTTTGNTIAFSAASNIYLVASTRPLSGIKTHITTGNGTISTATVKEWTGAAWASVTNLSDGTATGSISHAKTGVLSFDSTVNTSKPVMVDGQLYYWYTVSLSAGNTTIYHVTAQSPKQGLVDLWDGVNRVTVQCQISRSSVWEDYTAEVLDTSTTQYPICAKFAGITSSDHVILMFEDRMTALKVGFLAALVNKTAAVLTLYYWSGSAWVSVGTIYDGTLDSGGTIAMSRNGVIFWNGAGITDEHSQTLFGMHGYAYKLQWSGTLSADTGTYASGCYVDTLYGIPAVKTMGAYKFAFNYKNRVFLAGDLAGQEGHGIDFGAKDTADCYNGKDSSANGMRLYAGKNSMELVSAVNVFNRFGSNIYDSEVLLKTAETYLLDGDGRDTYKITMISDNIGTPWPRTVCTAEVAFEVTKDAIRNVAMWLSNTGPVLFDAAVLVPIRGVDKYFDKNNDECINRNVNTPHAWFDPNYYTWNICIPSGSTQVTCNVWLMYDMIRKEWYKRNVGTQYVPQATFKVIDDYGNTYYYGLIDSGHMVRLDHGSLWNDVEVIQGSVTTSAMVPTGNIFDVTTVRNIKLLTEGDGTYDVSYTRSDIEIQGPGITTGTLRVYGEIIEDPACTASYFDGENFVCKSITEDPTLSSLWTELNGDVTIKYSIYENWRMAIVTDTGDFVAAGFIDGLAILTSDTNNPGPFICTGVSATKLEFTTSKGVEFEKGSTITLYAMYVLVKHYENESLTPTIIVFNKLTRYDTFTHFVATCNKTAFSHKFEFVFYSTALQRNITPIAWGMEYFVERSDF